MCDEAVPVGHYSKTLLANLHLYDELKPKFAFAENVRAALALVGSGAADAGFVYATDLGSENSARVREVFRAGAAAGLAIRYPAAVLKSSKQTALAARYVQLLRSPAAQAVFKKYGFGPP